MVGRPTLEWELYWNSPLGIKVYKNDKIDHYFGSKVKKVGVFSSRDGDSGQLKLEVKLLKHF